jgi:hypothetical protein
MDMFDGIESILTVRATDGTLPDWWKFSSGNCRGFGALTVSADFGGACMNPYAGTVTAGYDAQYPAADRVQLRILVAGSESQALVPGQEYYAFRLDLKRTKSTGAGSCAGCDESMQIVQDHITLYENGATLPGNGVPVFWQSGNSSVPGGGATFLAIADVRWQPGGRAGTVSFWLPERGGAALELYDVGGRRWLDLALDGLGPGHHETELRAPAALPSGVYFLRLTQGGESARRSVVLRR